MSISNRRSRSSRNCVSNRGGSDDEHIESEIALKPERESLPRARWRRAYRIGDRAQAGTPRMSCIASWWSISNRRSRSSRNGRISYSPAGYEHIESEIALKPEPGDGRVDRQARAYRIGDRAQAGTVALSSPPASWSISNRRSRSSRNEVDEPCAVRGEHIESEIALKPERGARRRLRGRRAYRIGDRAQAGTCLPHPRLAQQSISNRRSRSSRNHQADLLGGDLEHIESEIALKPELSRRRGLRFNGAYRIGDRAQAGTAHWRYSRSRRSISNRRSRSSRNQN